MNETSNCQVISELKALSEEAVVNSAPRGQVSDFGPKKEFVKPTVYIGRRSLCWFERMSEVMEKFPDSKEAVSVFWRLEDSLVLLMMLVEKPVRTDGKIQAMATATVYYDGHLHTRLNEPVTVTLGDTPCPPPELIEKLTELIEKPTDDITKESMEDKAHI